MPVVCVLGAQLGAPCAAASSVQQHNGCQVGIGCCLCGCIVHRAAVGWVYQPTCKLGMGCCLGGCMCAVCGSRMVVGSGLNAACASAFRSMQQQDLCRPARVCCVGGCTGAARSSRMDLGWKGDRTAAASCCLWAFVPTSLGRSQIKCKDVWMVILATWMSQVFGVDRLWADSLGVFGHIHLAMRHVKGGCTLLPALSDLLP